MSCFFEFMIMIIWLHWWLLKSSVRIRNFMVSIYQDYLHKIVSKMRKIDVVTSESFIPRLLKGLLYLSNRKMNGLFGGTQEFIRDFTHSCNQNIIQFYHCIMLPINIYQNTNNGNNFSFFIRTYISKMTFLTTVITISSRISNIMEFTRRFLWWTRFSLFSYWYC